MEGAGEASVGLDLDVVSWHMRYYETSFLIYVWFAAFIVALYAVFYCLKVPAHRIPDLKDIIDNDDALNADFTARIERMNRSKGEKVVSTNHDHISASTHLIPISVLAEDE